MAKEKQAPEMENTDTPPPVWKLEHYKNLRQRIPKACIGDGWGFNVYSGEKHSLLKLLRHVMKIADIPDTIPHAAPSRRYDTVIVKLTEEEAQKILDVIEKNIKQLRSLPPPIPQPAAAHRRDN